MLLINPATEKFGGFMSRYVPTGVPVAIGCIIAHLERHGIRCKLIDEELIDITPSVLREAVEGLEKPYIIGLTCLTAHVGRAYQIAKMVKTEFPDSTVVLGGLHPTSLPDEALKTGVVDFVVRGEGEEVMLHLCHSIRGGEDISNLLGVNYIQGDEIINKPQAPLIPDINDIPMFPYHLFENPKYDMGFMTTSRGCPYRCSYCSQRLLTGTTYRYKSAQKIIEEVDILVNKYHQNQIAFYDDNFCLKARRVHELCDLLIENKFHEKVKLSVQTRADNILLHGGGDNLVSHMAEAGFSAMGFGLETGVQRLADLVRKDETIEDHLKTSRLCKKYGMDVSFFMIFGLPTETAAAREYSYQVVKSADLLSTKYNNIIPYPGTPLYTELKNSGRVVVTENWGNFNSTLSMTRSVFDKTPLAYVPDTCSEWELKRDITKYNYKSYVNWTALAGIFGHVKGSGFINIPKRWYLKPRELFEMGWIALQALINVTMAFLPLGITEPIMNTLNPDMKKRSRVKDYDPESYVTIDWDKIDMKQKTKLLKKARDVRKATGQVSIVVEE